MHPTGPRPQPGTDPVARRTAAVVIGAGHAGLAVSACLTDRGVPHVVLERGRIAQRWRDRWDSLTLLSADAYNRLPGQRPVAFAPDRFRHRDAFVAALETYARAVHAPVLEGVQVERVHRDRDGWRVRTDRGDWHAADVVVATGHCDLPRLPAVAANLPDGLRVLHSDGYRNPDQLAGCGGTILVVGAGASGQQIALELAEAGRAVVLAVGSHRRLPRRYRGRDVYWWLDQVGALHAPVDAGPPSASPPSAALSGRDGGRPLDLDVLERAGVRLAGRLQAVETGPSGPRACFADDLARTRGAADQRCVRWLDRFDAHARSAGLELPSDGYLEARRHGRPVVDRDPGVTSLPLAGVGAVLFATGYRRDFSWVDAPVFGADGEPRHRRGLTDCDGLQFMGLRGQHTRASGFIGGAAADAAHLADHIAARRAATRPPASSRSSGHAA